MILTLTYAVFLLLILRFCMVLFNFISNPRLPAAPRNYYDFVSVLIPGYVDLSQLAGLIQSIREQDFENYEVIVYGNGSSELEKVVEMASARNASFRVVQPEGTLETGGLVGSVKAGIDSVAGKSQYQARDRETVYEAPAETETICSYLASQAKGDYFLFLNRVERIEKGLIYNALYRMKLHSLGLLSLFTDQKMKTFSEGQLVPLVNYLLVSLLPLRLVLLSRWKEMAAASGQFLLFDASHYQTFQWHAVRGRDVPDGPAIVKKMKELGFRVESLFAGGYASGRMYAGRQGFGSFREDLISGFEGSAPALFLYLLLCSLGLFCLLPLLSMQLLGMALTLIAGMRIMSSLLGNQPVWWNLLFHPVQMAVLIWGIGVSIVRIVRKNH